MILSWHIYGTFKENKTKMSHNLSFNIVYDKVFNYQCFQCGIPSLLRRSFNFSLLFSVLLFSGLLFSGLLFSGFCFQADSE